ncbi:hypothetical protein C0989_001017 [Termitomyces sp. Mn162]|nr:hypothetical protein C0989_001017 [Termitomyces sp. Mn162]
MGPGVPRPPFSTNPPHPLPTPMPNPPADANYFGLPTPVEPPPPRWALGPALGNVGQPPGRGPPHGRPPGGWGLAMDNFPPQHKNGNNYYYYYNTGPLPRAQNPLDNTCNALAWEAKPITFQLESSQVAFAMLYLQGIAFNHYTMLLQNSQKAYETGWNYNALWFALHCALPQQIKDVLCLTPKQTTYGGYKALVT